MVLSVNMFVAYASTELGHVHVEIGPIYVVCWFNSNQEMPKEPMKTDTEPDPRVSVIEQRRWKNAGKGGAATDQR
jgi:hypothetical protein